MKDECLFLVSSRSLDLFLLPLAVIPVLVVYFTSQFSRKFETNSNASWKLQKFFSSIKLRTSLETTHDNKYTAALLLKVSGMRWVMVVSNLSSDSASTTLVDRALYVKVNILGVGTNSISNSCMILSNG